MTAIFLQDNTQLLLDKSAAIPGVYALSQASRQYSQILSLYLTGEASPCMTSEWDLSLSFPNHAYHNGFSTSARIGVKTHYIKKPVRHRECCNFCKKHSSLGLEMIIVFHDKIVLVSYEYSHVSCVNEGGPQLSCPCQDRLILPLIWRVRLIIVGVDKWPAQGAILKHLKQATLRTLS